MVKRCRNLGSQNVAPLSEMCPPPNSSSQQPHQQQRRRSSSRNHTKESLKPSLLEGISIYRYRSIISFICAPERQFLSDLGQSLPNRLGVSLSPRSHLWFLAIALITLAHPGPPATSFILSLPFSTSLSLSVLTFVFLVPDRHCRKRHHHGDATT